MQHLWTPPSGQGETSGLSWRVVGCCHLWTPPSGQGETSGLSWRVVGCCHLSGLWCGSEPPRACMGDAMGRAAKNRHHRRSAKPTECPMPELNDQSRSHTVLKQDSTLIAVLEMSQSAWLVAGLLPGIERHPLKKIEPDEAALLRLLRRWQDEATKAGHPITRITLAFDAGRDGFWLARWLRAHGIEAHVTHPTSVAVSREHRRAKTDRLDTALLKRAFLGWLRGE